MIGTRTDPHRFDKWMDMTEDQRSGECIDLIQDIIPRLHEMRRHLVRVPRTDAQQFAFDRVAVAIGALDEIKDDLLEEMLK